MMCTVSGVLRRCDNMMQLCVNHCSSCTAVIQQPRRSKIQLLKFCFDTFRQNFERKGRKHFLVLCLIGTKARNVDQGVVMKGTDGDWMEYIF